MECKNVTRTLQCICLCVGFCLGVADVKAIPKSSRISIDFLVNQPGKEEINILQSGAGLHSHRRNLEAFYLSQPFEIPIKNAYPFLTFTPVGDLDNYREEGFQFHVRFSKTGNDWTSWEEVPLFHEIDPEDTRYIGEMMYLDTTRRFLEFMIIFNNDAIHLAPIRVKNLHLDFFNPDAPRIPEFTKSEGDENFTANRAVEECNCSQPDFTDRVGWGSPDGNDFSGNGSPAITEVSHMIVHHSAGPNNSSNWAAAVLSIWNLHKNTNGWDDIGYNWLIDPEGEIYEGRGGGNNVRGAHFCGKNSGTMGICFLGNFETAQPSDAALQSLERLLAWKSCDAGLSPMDTTLHVSSGKTIPVISGHQDGCNTLCPGANLYPQLSNRVRVNTDSILNACSLPVSIQDITWISDVQVFPNPSSGKVGIKWTAQRSGALELKLLNYQGQVLYRQEISTFGGPHSLTLAATNLPGGLYFLKFADKQGVLTRKLVVR